MNLQDAIYNWLSIKVVADMRQTDQAARDTTDFFKDIITEDHGLTEIEVELTNGYYLVHYEKAGRQEVMKFPIELIEALLTINSK